MVPKALFDKMVESLEGASLCEHDEILELLEEIKLFRETNGTLAQR